MKNKVELKKYFKRSSICILIFLVITFAFNFLAYHVYTKNFNYKIYSILNVLRSEYPNITEQQIIEILNNNDDVKDNFLEKYGIELDADSIVLKNDKAFIFFVSMSVGITFSFSIILIIIYLKHNKRKDQDIEEISSYIEQINKGNYKLNIDNNTEDELSILKNEVYKTMIMLKEGAELSKKDKLSLKDSLSDISHQLKTPLTSIMITLDNLEENPDLDVETREKFIKSVKRDTANIKFLVETILKLSKLDTNAVVFFKKKTSLKKIIDESYKNVENLCDLRNIKIELPNKIVGDIICDFSWQVEAITNILKNAVEHAENLVKVEIEDNQIYTKISIINDGVCIDKKDINHVFERFYKGKNASKDSVGIGLALSKTIIEQDNGYISVDSNNNKTIFTIKYFKR